jgi:hypothetical protein
MLRHWRSWSYAPSSSPQPSGWPPPLRAPRSPLTRRRQQTGSIRSLACILGAPRDPRALAQPSGYAQGGEVGEQESRTAPHPTGPQRPDRPFRHGQPALGLQAHPRRAHETRPRGLGNDDPRRPAPLGSRPRAEDDGSKLVGVPARSSIAMVAGDFFTVYGSPHRCVAT